jgi:hypothetical protein
VKLGRNWLMAHSFNLRGILRVYRLEVLSTSGLVFWYLSLFPGRLGYDYALAIRMIQKGQASNFWTGCYFYFLKFATFNGRSIGFVSLIGLVTLASSLWWFIRSIPIDLFLLKKVFFILCWTPFVGVFGVTVSHDVFQTSGILLLMGFLLRMFLSRNTISLGLIVIFWLASIMLLATQTGLVIILFALAALLTQKKYMLTFLTFAMMLAILIISNLGFQVDSRSSGVNFLLFDLRCVSQHPQARISPSEWKKLEEISPKNQWMDPISCTNGDAQLAKMNINYDVAKLDPQFFKEYISIALRNPALVMMAHIQRSRGALPPPFFQGPDNQVILDPNVPLGIHSNIALQDGPELLHPSIDEPSVNKKFPKLKFLEFIAQIPTFLINQASWFWGWGGLWLWPITIFYVYLLNVRKVRKLLLLLQPILIHHLLMVILGPGALGRYYMSTILVGIICTFLIFMKIPSEKR